METYRTGEVDMDYFASSRKNVHTFAKNKLVYNFNK